MRTRFATATTPGRWRRRRTARIALATALIVAAPFVGGRGADTGDADGPARIGPGHPDSVHAGSVHAGSAQAGSAEAAATPGDTSAAGAETHPAARPVPHTGEAVRLVPVPLADAGVADVLGPGDLVDLIAVDSAHEHPHGHGPAVVARGARVRQTPDGRGGTRSILVEVPESAAASLAATAAGTPLAVVVHG